MFCAPTRVVPLIALFLAGFRTVDACSILVIDITGTPYRMLNPNKGNRNGGAAPGGAGISLGALGGFSDVVFQDFAQSNVFPTPTPTGFTVDFVPQMLIALADSITIMFPTVTGGWTFDVDETGPAETFTTGLFAFGGVGLGSDGKQYNLSFKASGSSGTFSPAPVVTKGKAGDPQIDIAHPYTITFFDVVASLDPVGSQPNLVSKGNIDAVGCTTCTVTIVPEPATLQMACLLAIVFGAASRIRRLQGH